MDIRMPELDGLEATRRILASNDTARILILTTFDLDEYVYEALRAGASGFVLKDDPPEQLLAAIRTVAGGDALLSPAVTKRVIRQFTRIPRPAPPKTHVTHILQKLGLRDRVQAVVLAYQTGLFERHATAQ
jgi:DNA-binding NarL/FixJ family response regulator